MSGVSQLKYYFPKPYEGEFLYSILARYFIHTNTTPEDFNRHRLLSKLKHNYPTTGSQLNKGIRLLRLFLDYLGPVRPPTWQELLRNHYSFNLISALTTNEVIDWFTAEGYVNFNRIPSSKILKKYHSPTLRYCDSCIDNQLEKHGESYWKTIHQYTDLNVCSVHKRQLRDTKISSNIADWLKNSNPTSTHYPHAITPNLRSQPELSFITRKPQLRMLELVTEFNEFKDSLHLTPSAFVNYIFPKGAKINSVCNGCMDCKNFYQHIPSYRATESNKAIGYFGCSDRWNREFMPFFFYLMSETCINVKPYDIYSEMLVLSGNNRSKFNTIES